MATRVTIDKFPVLMSGTISWPMVVGTSHAQQDFEVPLDLAGKILGLRGQRISLTIAPDPSTGNRPISIGNLYVLGEIPSTRPSVTKIRLVDRRYWWTRKWVRRRYNMRRKVGVYRLTHPDAASGLDQLAPVSEDFWYWKWSLYDGIKTPWTASKIIEDVLKQVITSEPHFQNQPSYQVVGEFAISSKIKDFQVENVEVDAQGDSAMNQVLRYIPDAKIHLDEFGSIYITPRNTVADNHFSDQAMSDLVGVEKWGQGVVSYVDNRFIMPSKITVFFDYECEVMFRNEESSTSAQVTTPAFIVDDTRTMDNVLPTPDPQIVINQQKVLQQTWVKIDDYLTGEYVHAGTTKTINERIDKPLIRIACIPFVGLWGNVTDANDAAFDPDNNWPERVAAIEENYRRTYRLNPNWVDKCFGIREYRVATVDPAKGQRASAAAWQDFSIVPSQKGFARYHNAGLPVPRFINISGYISEGSTAVGKVPPADVKIIDHDQGIVRIVFRPDVLKNAKEVIPSMVNGFVTSNVKKFNNSSSQPIQGQSGSAFPQIAFNAVLGSGNTPGVRGAPASLSETHNVAVMLTLLPATNNMFGVEISYESLAGIIPIGAKPMGPPMEIHVGAGVETARVRWSERAEDRRAVEQLFQVNLPRDTPPPDIRHLVVNFAEQDKLGSSAASLKAIARAVAARVYTQYASRLMGRKVGRLTQGVEPFGWIDTVTHGVTTSGETFTAIEFPDHLQQLDFMSLLPPDTRAIILREVHRKPA